MVIIWPIKNRKCQDFIANKLDEMSAEIETALATLQKGLGVLKMSVQIVTVHLRLKQYKTELEIVAGT